MIKKICFRKDKTNSEREFFLFQAEQDKNSERKKICFRQNKTKIVREKICFRQNKTKIEQIVSDKNNERKKYVLGRTRQK